MVKNFYMIVDPPLGPIVYTIGVADVTARKDRGRASRRQVAVPLATSAKSLKADARRLEARDFLGKP